MSLSASKLNLYRDCALCFWLSENKKIQRPRGIFPSLPGGVDRVMKHYYDKLRSVNEIIPGYGLFADQVKMDKMRNWRTGLTCIVDGEKIIGAMDDVVIKNHDGTAAPFDNKSRGSEPTQEASEKYYGAQIDIYSLLLGQNGYRLSGEGFLNYVWPIRFGEGNIGIGHRLITMTADPHRAVSLIKEARACLAGPQPDPSADCEQCRYVKFRGGK